MLLVQIRVRFHFGAIHLDIFRVVLVHVNNEAVAQIWGWFIFILGWWCYLAEQEETRQGGQGEKGV